jgi:DNA polymerase-1
MKPLYLLIDGNNMVARNFFGIPPMTSPDGDRVEAIYGMLRDIRKLQKKFFTPHVVFCFDHGKPKRLNLLPTYKESRKESKRKRKGTERDDKYLQSQLYLVKERVLPRMGFNNVLFCDGYEADDLIVLSHWYGVQPIGGRSVVVSTDKDFHQCVADTLTIYNPNEEKEYTRTDLAAKYGLDAGKLNSQLISMKAIAGCTTDDVPGVEGVGEKTACKWINGTLKKESMAYEAISKAKKLIESNRKLVTLPIDHAVDISLKLEEDTFSMKKWKKVLLELGFYSLLKKV